MEAGEEAGRDQMERKEEVRSKVCLAYTYDTQIDATQYAEEIVKPISKKKNAEGEKSGEEVEEIRRSAERRRSETEGVREKADQLRIKVLKWKEERQKAIKREKKWRKEIGEPVSDSSDDENTNGNTDKTKESESIRRGHSERERASSDRTQEDRRGVTKGVECQKDLPAEEILAKDRTGNLMPVSRLKECFKVTQKDEERKIKSADETAEKRDLVKEEVAGIVHCKEKFMVENEWSARELIEKSVHKFDSRKEAEESVEKCQTESVSVTVDNAEKVLKRPKREKSAPRRIRKKTPLGRSKSEPVEGLPEDDQSEVRRQEWRSNIVQEGWKEVVERVKRQRAEQAILDEKKRKADEIKAETQKKEEKLRQDLEVARLAEEKEKEELRAAELAEEQRWIEEEKKRKEQNRKWQEAVDRINLQAAEESKKEQEREREEERKGKQLEKERIAKENEQAKELDEIQREIEERGEMHVVVEEYWKTKGSEEEEDELSRALAEEEEWWSGSGREEEQRREREIEERRQEAIKRELDNHQSKIEQEKVKRVKEEVIKKLKCAMAEVENARKIEIERERALERALMSRPIDKGTQESLSDVVRRRVMKRYAEKEREEEEKRRLEERKKESTLRQSLFPNMPIYVNFVTANSLPDIVGRNLSEGLKNMGWHVWAPRGRNAVPDKSQNEGWTIQSKN